LIIIVVWVVGAGASARKALSEDQIYQVVLVEAGAGYAADTFS